MKIEDIELDPNPPQKGEPVTVSVNTKLFKSYNPLLNSIRVVSIKCAKMQMKKLMAGQYLY